jgi:hypothetical protein
MIDEEGKHYLRTNNETTYGLVLHEGPAISN